jgi:hypothetical protein
MKIDDSIRRLEKRYKVTIQRDAFQQISLRQWSAEVTDNQGNTQGKLYVLVHDDDVIFLDAGSFQRLITWGTVQLQGELHDETRA